MKKTAAIIGIAVLAWTARAGWTQQNTEDTATQQSTSETTETTTTTTNSNTESAKAGTPAVLQQWPEASRTIASSMMEKYGQPDEFTQGQLIWHDRAPFKRIVVYRFPTYHYDMLAETVDYFFGSQFQQGGANPSMLQLHETTVTPDVGKFELTSLSNSEDNNILALNLANDVYAGRISANQARQGYSDATMRTLSGKTVAATQGLDFTPARPQDSEWSAVIGARQGSGG